MTSHALAVFHRDPEDLNCSQTILDAYQTVSGKHVASLAEYKAFGGGRAPDNECGALYAACQCIPEAAAEMRTEFSSRLGSLRCKDLKRELRVPCKDCVATAADILQAHEERRSTTS